ncbi:CWF19-like protein 2 [Ascaphus truei]|uniref:CWF19-like protein 2 n=1 Tax=Ascaphus truei TaxID=8439 RepID=UPI003F59EB0D
MAEYGASFESASSIKERKESKRRAREQLLSKAKCEHEKEERRQEQKRLRGEDTWMLSDVNERLEELQQEHSGKKHHKKAKKEKKKKSKKPKPEKNDDSSESSPGSEEDWVEAAPSQSGSREKAWKIRNETAEIESAPPVVERDEWMTLDFMSLKATSVAALRAEKQKEKTLEHEKAQAVEKEKIQARELNPYWKDGGTGLPPGEGDVTSVKKVVHVEDGGLGWLRKSYQRMKEQSERQKRSLEDIIAERYGSMEIFQNKMNEAEKAASQNFNTEHDGRRERWRKSKYHDNESRRSVKPGQRINDERSRDRYTDYQRHDKATHKEGCEYNGGKPRGDQRESYTNRPESEHKRYVIKSFGEGGVPERSEDTKSPFRLKHQFLKPSEEDHSFDAAGFKPQNNTSLLPPQASLRNSFQKPASDDTDASWRRTPSKDQTCEEEIPKSKMEDCQINEIKDTEEKLDKDLSIGEQQSSSSSPDIHPQSARILSEEEMNKLGAKLIKAELMGNMDLASKLKTQLEEARRHRQSQPQAPPSITDRKSNTEGASLKEDHEVLLVRTDQSGRAWPVNAMADPLELKGGRRKRPMVATHVEKERVRYFHDDDNQSLQDLVKKEKMGTSEDQNKLFMRMASKYMEKTDQDYYTLDDMFVSKAAKKEHPNQEEERERRTAISEHQKLAARMEKCPYCFDNAELPKHLIIAIGLKVYLCLPNHVSLTEGHCLIVPLQHYTATTLLDEDIWNEIQMFRKTLVKMFEVRGLDCVFLESNINTKRRFHLVYECIPLPKEVGDMAPIYFKKAIMESDEEWSMNKKLIDLSKKDIRRSVPKGLPYFSVDFGLQGGFAHVVENQHKFPHYFGKEIIGGMLDLEPRVWRKALRENFDDQRKKVLQFAQWWKPYNFTKTTE